MENVLYIWVKMVEKYYRQKLNWQVSKVKASSSGNGSALCVS